MKIYGNFEDAVKESVLKLLNLGIDIHPNNWQSMSVGKVQAARMKELLALSFQVMMPATIEELRNEIKPNLPWADKHFELERVSREPINPGETWKEWPWANSADKFRTQTTQFDHSYAERYWPRFAGFTPDGTINEYRKTDPEWPGRYGIRNRVGDLDDIIERLEKDPTTRQAVLSVWHPEDQVDTGKRVPCSLTYQFLMRNDYLHVIYNIRSCDAYRHFRDDLYLTARLALWIISELQQKDSSWDNVTLGLFTIQVGSFHCFVNDVPQLEKWL
jgi:thymidylate synthase